MPLDRDTFDFRREFEKKLVAHDPNYAVRGVITADRRVYPLGTDTKVLSTVFELIARPLVFEIAQEHGLQVMESEKQNVYPDFSLMESVDAPGKIAVDVKTTYRKRDTDWRVKFTLGSYTSFIRSDTKNIQFPYSQYSQHWIIGFIYRRKHVQSLADAPVHVYTLEQLDSIPIPYEEDVYVFVQEKWKIAGDRPGSGNTANIGSILGTFEDFQSGLGVFQSEAEFLQYWRGYERTATVRHYRNIKEFRDWMGRPSE